MKPTDMKSGIKVGDIMTRNFISVKPQDSLHLCSKHMVKNKVGSLLIKDGDNIHGILTEGDIIGAIVRRKNADLKKIQARDVSAKKLITVKPEDDLLIALSKMKKSYHKRLPVVADKKVVGMITIKDILKIQPSLLSEMTDIIKIKEETEKMNRITQMPEAKISGEGICEECGNRDTLYKADGALLCESCMP